VRFLIDASMIRGGGGFTFAANLLPALARVAPADRFRVLLRSKHLAEALPALPNLELSRLPERAGWLERLRFTYREAPRLAAEYGADLYYSAGDYAPVGVPCPVVASFQNLNLFTDLEIDYPRAQRLRLAALRRVSRLTARTCDAIHFVSESSARVIGERVGVPERRRIVVSHGIDARRWRPTREERARRADGYILSVSSVYPYKNYVRLIRAWADLARRHPELADLVIVGDDQDAPYLRQMERARDESGFAERIHFVGGVSHAEVRRYYAGASLFVFPSYLETFGLPLLEAMASEVPIAASDIPSFREVAGDAAFYFDPHDENSIGEAMKQALFAEGAGEILTKRGRARVRELSWERSAASLLGALRSLIAQGSPGAGPPRRRVATRDFVEAMLDADL